MTPTSNPHAQTHYWIRAAHAKEILRREGNRRKYGIGVGGPTSTKEIPARARHAFRKAQSKLKGKDVMKHAANKLTSTSAWKMMRRKKGLPA